MKGTTLLLWLIFILAIPMACAEFRVNAEQSLTLCSCNLSQIPVIVTNTGGSPESYILGQSGSAAGFITTVPDFISLEPGAKGVLMEFIRPACGAAGNYELTTTINQQSFVQKFKVVDCRPKQEMPKILKVLPAFMIIMLFFIDLLLVAVIALKPGKSRRRSRDFESMKDDFWRPEPRKAEPAKPYYESSEPKIDRTLILRTIFLVAAVIIFVIAVFAVGRRLPSVGNLITTYVPNITTSPIQFGQSPYLVYLAAGVVVLVAVLLSLNLFRQRPSQYYEPVIREPGNVELPSMPLKKILLVVLIVLIIAVAAYTILRSVPSAAPVQPNSTAPQAPSIGAVSGVGIKFNINKTEDNTTKLEELVGATQPSNESSLFGEPSMIGSVFSYVNGYLAYAIAGFVILAVVIAAMRLRAH